jgi:hypothetical protein
MQTISAEKYFKNGSGMVTLCGSTRFFAECMEANRLLTFQNWVVLMCGSWGHSYHKDSEDLNRDYTMVKRLHFQKIIESDAIVVVSDKTLYYGESTVEEIAFAQFREKPVFYYNGEILSGWDTISELPNRYADSSLIDDFRQSIRS